MTKYLFVIFWYILFPKITVFHIIFPKNKKNKNYRNDKNDKNIQKTTKRYENVNNNVQLLSVFFPQFYVLLLRFFPNFTHCDDFCFFVRAIHFRLYQLVFVFLNFSRQSYVFWWLEFYISFSKLAFLTFFVIVDIFVYFCHLLHVFVIFVYFVIFDIFWLFLSFLYFLLFVVSVFVFLQFFQILLFMMIIIMMHIK